MKNNIDAKFIPNIVRKSFEEFIMKEYPKEVWGVLNPLPIEKFMVETYKKVLEVELDFIINKIADLPRYIPEEIQGLSDHEFIDTCKIYRLLQKLKIK